MTDYFASLDVALSTTSLGYGDASAFVDLHAGGKQVEIPSSVQWTNETAVGLALAKYLEIVQQYPFLADGYHFPTELPEDLLSPFGEFLDKYDLGAIIFTVSQYSPGYRDLLTVPTLYVMKSFTADMAATFLGLTPPFLAVPNGNQDLYNQAAHRLGEDVFLDATVVGVHRHRHHVTVGLKSPGSKPRSIKAKKLLIGIPPTLTNVIGLGLVPTLEEVSLFSQFRGVYYWDAVVNVTGLPNRTALLAVDLEAPYALAELPTSYGFIAAPGFDDLYVTYVGSLHRESDEVVKRAILGDLAKVVTSNGYNISGTPSIVALNNHSPYQLTVPAKAIEHGFYDKLNSLQGQDNTWWTGAAWQAQDSSLIWNWTEYNLLPKIHESLQKARYEDIDQPQQTLQEL